MKTFYVFILLLVSGAFAHTSAQKIEFKVGGVKMGHVDDTRLAFQYGSGNLFIGESAGDLLAGLGNTAVGVAAGNALNGSNFNVILGRSTGFSLAGGHENTFLGAFAGYQNVSGSGNVFVGYRAGFSETGSNRLYIANTSSGDPLIYGEFPNQLLRFYAPAEFFGDIRIDKTTPRMDYYDGPSLLAYTASVGANFTVANELSGKMYFRNNGSIRMTINDAGRVGIGTDSPTQKLHVSGKIRLGDDATAPDAGTIRYNSTSDVFEGYDGSAWNSFAGGHWTKTGSDIYYNTGYAGVGTTAPQERLHVYGSIRLEQSQPTFRFYQGSTFASYFQQNGTTLSIANRLAGNMTFHTKGSLQMQIDSAGLVGIGNNTPTQKLHVNGKLKIGNDGITPSEGVLRYNSVDSIFEGYDGTSWSSLSGGGGHWTKVGNELNYLNGNVGILIADPAFDLHVGGEVAIDGFAPTIYFRDDPEAYGLITSSQYGMRLNNQTTYATKFDINGDTKMALTSTGRLGIGTESPATQLHVIGDAHFEDVHPRLGLYQGVDYVGYWAQIGDDMSLVNREAGRLYLKTSDATRLTISSTGYVGIGTTAPAANLHVMGDAYLDDVHPRLGLYQSGNYVGYLVQIGDDMSLVNKEAGNLYLKTSDITRLTILQNGEVGIGGTNTSHQLHVEGPERYGTYIKNTYAGTSTKYGLYVDVTNAASEDKYGVYAKATASASQTSSDDIIALRGLASADAGSTAKLYGVYGVVDADGGSGSCGLYGLSGNSSHYALYADGISHMAGDVRIGYTADVPGYLLAVDGKIISEELRVELSGSWPDYVFREDYHLLPLHQLEAKIRDTGHLPGVPSAEEVEDGFHVGEMNRVLLEKVEELTLYIIQQQKEIEALKAEVQTLKH